ncbi:MAG: hypothetical protein MUO31_01055 [Thermodesulfovibrionales bacterium]|nr:hypothetical protein [Thermodesulfovibrionales bacterium]
MEREMGLLTGFNFRDYIARTKSKISATVIIVVFLALVFGMHGGTPIEHAIT